MARRNFFNAVLLALCTICFIPDVHGQISKTVQLLPLGNILLIPLGRSSIEANRIEIRINDHVVPYEITYDGYGGYWANVSSNELDEYSILAVRYTRQMENVSDFHRSDEAGTTWITPSPFIDSDNSAIREQAFQIYDDTRTIKENVGDISEFVTGHLTFDQQFHRSPASLSASQTLLQRKGVCINFSRLFIALCRANGIPARSVSGIVLNRDDPDQYDFHHEWAEFMDEEGFWHPIDLTYTHVMNLSDIRYTDLVYAAEDHPYFAESSNINLAAGRPLALENDDIVLFHYHPIFPGAKYGFVLLEDHRPEYFVIEKKISMVKRRRNIIIIQYSDSTIERCESPENLEELVVLQSQIENSSVAEYEDEVVQKLPDWLRHYSGKEFRYEQSLYNTTKCRFDIDYQRNEMILTVYNSDNIPTILKPGLMGDYFLNRNEQGLIIAAKASIGDNTIVWNTVIPKYGWAAKYTYKFADEILEVNVVDINGNTYTQRAW